MHVEIVEFYPLEFNENNGFLSGTLRIKLDVGIHILGVYACKRRESWFFQLPGKISTHHETGELVRYPYLVFEDQEKHRELIEAIREKGRAFIEKRLADIEKPLVFPQKKQQQQKQKSQPQPPTHLKKCVEPDPIVKKTTSTEVKPIALTKKIEWKDPPKRPPVKSKAGYGYAKR